MQDAIAIAVSLAAAIWLVRTLTRQFFAPPCRGPSDTPAGSDGFVPLDSLRPRK